VLRDHRAAFAADPKDPAVTDAMEFDVDIGDARPVRQKQRH